MADKKEKKPNWFKRTGAAIKKWFRGMKGELKKVVWPSKKQVINNTIVVIICSIILALVVWAFDELASLGVNALLSIAG